MHRLGTERRQIDDGQSPMAECDAGVVVTPEAVGIGAAVDNRVGHRFHRRLWRTGGRCPEESCDPAHIDQRPGEWQRSCSGGPTPGRDRVDADWRELCHVTAVTRKMGCRGWSDNQERARSRPPSCMSSCMLCVMHVGGH